MSKYNRSTNAAICGGRKQSFAFDSQSESQAETKDTAASAGGDLRLGHASFPDTTEAHIVSRLTDKAYFGVEQNAEENGPFSKTCFVLETAIYYNFGRSQSFAVEKTTSCPPQPPPIPGAEALDADPENNASFKGTRLGGARRWLLERMNREGGGGGAGGGQDLSEPLPDIDEGDEAAEDDAAAFELVRTRDQAVQNQVKHRRSKNVDQITFKILTRHTNFGQTTTSPTSGAHEGEAVSQGDLPEHRRRRLVCSLDIIPLSALKLNS